MQAVERKFGQQFLLARAATRFRRFTINELHRATEVPENTIYSFVARLHRRGDLETEELSSVHPGRPRKRYLLTESGLDYLLRRNALVISLAQGEQVSGTAPIVPTTPAIITPQVQSTPNVATWYSSAAAGAGQPSPARPVAREQDDESDEGLVAAY
jgi:hypothetical protein